MAGEMVAYLEIQRCDRDADETPSVIEIRGNEEFYLGRNSSLCRHTWPDPVISNKHVRIHCILYEQNPVADIPPFVYATDVSSNGTYLRKSNAECSSSQGRGIRMGRKNGSFLLDEADELRISDSVTLVYRSLTKILEEPLPAFQLEEKHAFMSRYVITGRVLGIGGYGKVLIAVHQKTQRQLACKVMDIRNFYANEEASKYNLTAEKQDEPGSAKRWPSRVGKCFREFDILKDLSHPNIVTIEKVFWSSNSIYIFQELVSGGDLFSYLEYKGGHLCEVEAAVIVRQILKGVVYLHDQNIVHRDLKPDNILMTSLDEGARIVITDFGNARFLPDEQGAGSAPSTYRRRMFSICGTLEFTAPEIHKMNPTVPTHQGYSKSIDMWSIGSITVALLSGDAPFADRWNQDFDRDPKGVMMNLASRCDLSFLDEADHDIWSNVSSRSRDFIKKLLVLQEDARMTATEALAHSWFTNHCHNAAFESLYQRAIRDWRPRRKVFRLVEPIAETVADLTTVGLPEEFLSQEVVSKYFSAPSRKPSHFQIDSSLTASQAQRVNTPLPAILEDREDDNYQSLSLDDDISYDIRGSYPMNLSRGYSLGDSMDQLALIPEDRGLYGVDYDPDNEFPEYNEAHQAYDSQARSRVQTPDREPDSSVVYETPVKDLGRRRSGDHSPQGCFKRRKLFHGSH
ncbi:Pkinase-domain-containing protein, partial [Lophiostoma macrostomum CBS 122681]